MALISPVMPRSIRRRIDDWISTRNPPSPGAIRLESRRLYILPTRFGYLFGAMLFFLFLAAINYQNSMAFLLTFMLTAMAIISLWQTHKNLLGLEVSLKTPRAVFCGESSEFVFTLNHQTNVYRYAVGIQYGNQAPAYVTIEPEASAQAVLEIPAHRRAQFNAKGLRFVTR